jgi:hypothetical protein
MQILVELADRALDRPLDHGDPAAYPPTPSLRCDRDIVFVREFLHQMQLPSFN